VVNYLDKLERSKSMKTFLMLIVLTMVLFVSVAQLPESPLRLGFVRNAEAIIGMPWTPLSFAGVARRSMYREAVATSAMNAAAANAAAANMAAANAAAAQAAAANAAAAQAAAANAAAAAAAAQQAAATLPIGTTVPYLPPNCNSSLINGINYFNCGGVYYRAGFQGNSVVYIVSVP
jgi:multidrug efflux pump subunit AcrA (membrane-fusion protein)